MDQRIQKQVDYCRQVGTHTGLNIIAYSGGVDSSLAALLVKRAFPENTIAYIGISPSLSERQLAQARQIADQMDIPLREVQTDEGAFEGYVNNEGQACFFCKTSLYSTLEQVAQEAIRQNGDTQIVLYNGTNKDDLKDPTRVGLVAARNHEVASPLANLTKDEVRAMAKYLGLANWNYAASPCLRSRLAYGVKATPDSLRRVDRAESIIRHWIDLKADHNMRVRTLADDLAIIELDADLMGEFQRLSPTIKTALLALGFKDVECRAFRSGSLSRPFQNAPKEKTDYRRPGYRAPASSA